MAKKFLYDIFTPEHADAIIFGVPLGKNSQQDLDALRKASWFVESFDVDRKKDLLENVKIADVGNIELKDLDEITKKTEEIIERGKVPVILGGGHLLSFYSIQALENAKLIVFDAHSDLADKYEDEKLVELYQSWFDPKCNGATWLRRYCEKRNPENVCIIGLRSCDKDIMKFIVEKKILYFTPSQIRKDIGNVKKKLREFTKGSPLYISIDIDVFDPSIVPTVDYPEPDGLLFDEFREVVDAIEGRVLGIDLTELKEVGKNEAVGFLAVKVIFEILSLLSI